jgi:hypothetical protein
VMSGDLRFHVEDGFRRFATRRRRAPGA